MMTPRAAVLHESVFHHFLFYDDDVSRIWFKMRVLVVSAVWLYVSRDEMRSWISTVRGKWLAVRVTFSYPEEIHCGSTIQSPVRNVGLVSEIRCTLNRCALPVHGEESGEIGSIGWHYNKRKKPPDPSHQPRRRSLRKRKQVRGQFLA